MQSLWEQRGDSFLCHQVQRLVPHLHSWQNLWRFPVFLKIYPSFAFTSVFFLKELMTENKSNFFLLMKFLILFRKYGSFATDVGIFLMKEEFYFYLPHELSMIWNVNALRCDYKNSVSSYVLSGSPVTRLIHRNGKLDSRVTHARWVMGLIFCSKVYVVM